jgi:outer membrane protein OmpA-like peptidoglycan-associated protein
VLDAVAALMRERQDILLVRIEAYAARDPGDSPTARRRELDETQRRADAVLAYLWRKRGISAERLEAVGHGSDRRIDGAARYLVVFRVVQRSETVPAAPAVR